MIDIHCHILPQLDDGADSIQTSLQMCRQAIDNGYTDIIATPHHLKGSFHNPGAIVHRSVALLNQALTEEGLAITIHAGQEIRFHEDLLVNLQNGSALPLAGSRYLLLELPSYAIPMYTTSLIFQLCAAGYIPIIAHPERNITIQKSPDKLAELLQQGALAQLTWTSLQASSRLKKISKQLIRQGLIHFIATDAHDCRHRPINSRSIQKRIISPLIKNHLASWEEHASKILLNEPIS